MIAESAVSAGALSKVSLHIAPNRPSRHFIRTICSSATGCCCAAQSFLNLDLHERIAITLLELASDFGIKESRGALLKASFSHQDIADLVGASRPRVTEHLAQLEREHLIIRQGRQFIVRVDKIGGIERTTTRHDDDASAKLVS